MIVHLENRNPTKIEKALFKYAGYYVVDIDSAYGSPVIKYAVCHPEEGVDKFLESIEIDTADIEYENTITFECLSESIIIHGNVDIYMMYWIVERARELGWKMPERYEVNNDGIMEKK